MKTIYRWISLVAAAMIVAGTAAFAGEARTTTNTTYDNLKTAFDGQSNVNKKYIAFNAKAYKEGYRRAAQLFRAAARSKATQAALFGTLISRFGEKPGVRIMPGPVRSTRENLTAAKDEGVKNMALYKGFADQAQADGMLDAAAYFTYVQKVEDSHGKLFQQALDNLESWKEAGAPFSDCNMCGNTVEKVDFEACPVCGYPASGYTPVK